MVTESPSHHELPTPTAEMQAIESRLTAHIAQHIQDNAGFISLRDFMQDALYTPGLGYYSAGLHKFGPQGDFITAPETSALFSRCIARQCQEVLVAIPDGDILEAGAGSGRLAADCLAELEQLDCLPRRYLILELSPSLRSQQQQTLQDSVPQLLDRVEWLDTLPDEFTGVVLANELLDAMPVEQFCVQQDRVLQSGVGLQNDELVWRFRENTELENQVNDIASALGQPFANGYRSEINLEACAWVSSMAERLKHGVMLFIDYGHSRSEFYHPQRQQGTLRCYYRQRVHDNPLILIGLQDITAHVDFTAIAETAHAAGLHVNGYTTQAHFLLSLGIEHMLSPQASTTEQLQQSQEIKKLVMPGEMGERFKVIALSHGFDTLLKGFILQDHRSKL